MSEIDATIIFNVTRISLMSPDFLLTSTAHMRFSVHNASVSVSLSLSLSLSLQLRFPRHRCSKQHPWTDPRGPRLMFRAAKITLGIDFRRVTLINSAIVRPEGLFICWCSGAQRARCRTKGPFSEPAKPRSRAEPSRAAPRRVSRRFRIFSLR